MSIEYFGNPDPTLSSQDVRVVVDSILAAEGFRVVRHEDSELGIAFSENENPDQETVTVSVKPDQIYAGFHACHVEQRDKILEFLASCVRQSGSSCEFDEK